MSHHAESSLARQHPQLDIADTYLFRGAAGSVFIMTLNPLSGPGGFHPGGVHEFCVCTSPQAGRDLVFRVTFGPEDAAGRQLLRLQALTGKNASELDAAGTILASGQTQDVIAGQDGLRVWAGTAADPFYINGPVVSAVAQAVQGSAPLDIRALAGIQPVNLFAGCNVNAIVLEVPDRLLSAWTRSRPGSPPRPGPESPSLPPGRIGFWATTTLRDGSSWLKVQRCATPRLPTMLFAPDGHLADAYQATEPAQDRENYGPLVAELAGRAAAALGAADPVTHGASVRDQLFPDVLWYQAGTPAQFGFGRRNGRGLRDPAAEVMFALVLGRAVPLCLDPGCAALSPHGAFPYLGAPVPVPASAPANATRLLPAR